jgi:uncharacterized protein YggE
MKLRRVASLVAGLALLAAPLAARAQAVVRAAPAVAGINVTGSGYVRRPADALRYSIVLALRGNGPNAVSSTSIFTAADALVDALKHNGSPDAAVADSPNGINQTSVATVRGTLRKPSLDKVRALVAAVTAALPADGVPIQQINYTALLDDCAEPERAAQAAAVDDAHARAAGIASALHRALGEVTAVTEGFVPQGACPTKPDATVPMNGFNGGAISPDAFNVTIGVTLNVWYAIGGPR